MDNVECVNDHAEPHKYETERVLIEVFFRIRNPYFGPYRLKYKLPQIRQSFIVLT